MIRSALLLSLPGLAHAHSTRAEGPIGPRELAGAAEARAALVRAVGADPASLVTCGQVHGSRVATALRGGGFFPATDALVTAPPGIALLVQGADCPLVLLYDPAARVLAVVHSGWRGTVGRVAAEAVTAMGELGSTPRRICAAIFPGIGPCCFEVGLDVRDAMEGAFGAQASSWFGAASSSAKRLLDLRAAILATLLDAGVRRNAIDLVPGCTACDGRFYSHRASRGSPERHGLCAAMS